jgi:hypothetical protein
MCYSNRKLANTLDHKDKPVEVNYVELRDLHCELDAATAGIFTVVPLGIRVCSTCGKRLHTCKQLKDWTIAETTDYPPCQGQSTCQFFLHYVHLV